MPQLFRDFAYVSAQQIMALSGGRERAASDLKKANEILSETAEHLATIVELLLDFEQVPQEDREILARSVKNARATIKHLENVA